MKITAAIQKKIDREITRRNRVFKKASNAKKRVLIAKDVLKQIAVKKFLPRPGYWYHLPPSIDNCPQSDAPLQQALLSTNKREACTGCALGSLFISCTLFNNNVTISEAETENANGAFGRAIDTEFETKPVFHNGLDQIFSRKQLELIEYVFEQRGLFDHDTQLAMSTAAKDAWLAKFPARKSHAKARLIAIMKNIIANNGTFKPNQILKKNRATSVSRR